MDQALLLEQVMERCIHFTGTHNETCAAGVVYDTSSLPCFRLPCFRANSRPTCPLEHFPELEESRRIVAHITVYTEQDIENFNNNLCPVCGAKIAERVHSQYNHCVNAKPCGHLLYERKTIEPTQSELTPDQDDGSDDYL